MGGVATVWPRWKRGAPVLMLMRCFIRSKAGITLVEFGVAGRDAALDAVGLVPEARALGILQEIDPPAAMDALPRPALQAVQVAPVLAHPQVGRDQREQHVLVAQQAVGP